VRLRRARLLAKRAELLDFLFAICNTARPNRFKQLRVLALASLNHRQNKLTARYAVSN